MSAKRVLITGASGFVGANLCRRLLTDGLDLHLIVRQDFKPWRLMPILPELHVHLADLTQREETFNLIAAIRPEQIYHLAVYGAYSSQTHPLQMIRTNLESTVNLLDACCRTEFEVFVNTGSSSEYGFKDHAPPEDEPLEPNSMYAVTKAAATHYCRFVAQSCGVRVPTLRLYSVYGRYEEPTRLIPTLLTHGLSGTLPPLVDPLIARDYVFVNDVCAAYVATAQHESSDPGAVYNVASGHQTTLREIVAIVRALLHVQAEPVWGSMSDRAWDTSTWIGNPERIRWELGWEASTTLTEGLQLTADWLRADPEMLAFYRTSTAPQQS